MAQTTPHGRYETTVRDRYGFVAHMRWRTYVVPSGIALIVAAVGVASFLMLLPAIAAGDAQVLADGLDRIVKAESDSFLDLSFGDAHIVAALVFVGMVAVGVLVLGYARNDRIAYMEAFPHVDLAFSPEDVEQSQAVKRYCLGVGFGLWGVAVALFAVFKVFGLTHIATGCLFCVGALGTWMIVHGGMRAKREDLYAYNFEALKQSSYYELNADVTGADRDWVLGAKRLSMLAQTTDRILLTVGALASFALYALPTLVTPYYWVPIAATGLLALYNTHRAMVRSKELVQRPAESKGEPGQERAEKPAEPAKASGEKPAEPEKGSLEKSAEPEKGLAGRAAEPGGGPAGRPAEPEGEPAGPARESEGLEEGGEG